MRNESVETLALAFFDDPVMKHFLPLEAKRLRALRLLMRFFIALSKINGRFDESFEGRKGAMVSFHHGHYPIPIFRTIPVVLRYAVPALFIGIRPSTVWNALKLLSIIEGLHPDEAHHYVLVIGVLPVEQGKGVGSELMAPLLKDADETNTAVYLESSDPRNLSFYKKLGFENLEEIRPLKRAPPLWRMLRQPVRT